MRHTWALPCPCCPCIQCEWKISSCTCPPAGRGEPGKCRSQITKHHRTDTRAVCNHRVRAQEAKESPRASTRMQIQISVYIVQLACKPKYSRHGREAPKISRRVYAICIEHDDAAVTSAVSVRNTFWALFLSPPSELQISYRPQLSAWRAQTIEK